MIRKIFHNVLRLMVQINYMWRWYGMPWPKDKWFICDKYLHRRNIDVGMPYPICVWFDFKRDVLILHLDRLA